MDPLKEFKELPPIRINSNRIERKQVGRDAVISGVGKWMEMGKLGSHGLSFSRRSMSSVVGEKLPELLSEVWKKIPVIIVSASGARMYEEFLVSCKWRNFKCGACSVRLAEAGIPYFPCSPIQWRSYGKLRIFGECYSSRPKALIGFAGRRVIKGYPSRFA